MDDTKPVIGISSSVVDHGDIPSVHVHQKYISSVIQAGGIPVVIPLVDDEMAKVIVSKCDGFILSGGEDVDPHSYGEDPDPKLRKTSGKRDEMELAVVKYAKENKKPVFGICRGIAMLNAALGGTVTQDIESNYENPIKHYQTADRPNPTHEIMIEKGSKLQNIFGTETVRVNSMHHQAVGKLADGLVATAKATDGIIEGIEGTDNEWYALAVQWHPEEMAAQDEAMHNLFKTFVGKCKKK
jgi:putative glutamine amidotransferase